MGTWRGFVLLMAGGILGVLMTTWVIEIWPNLCDSRTGFTVGLTR